MKKIPACLVIALTILIACTKEHDERLITCASCEYYSYKGKWKLVAEYASTGAGENPKPVTDGFEIEIKNDSTYTVSTPDDLIIGTQGKMIFRNRSTWVTNYSHGTRSVEPEPNIRFIHRDTFLMRSFLTQDSAALKFARIGE